MNCLSLKSNARDVILAMVMEAVVDLTPGCDRTFATPIGPDTRLIADLGCQSLDIVVLFGDLSRQLNRGDIPLEQLVRKEGKPVLDISIGTLADFLWEQTIAAQLPTNSKQIEQ
jgi:acyl carrier protein